MGNQFINIPKTTEYTDKIGTFEILGVRRGKTRKVIRGTFEEIFRRRACKRGIQQEARGYRKEARSLISGDEEK